jgi:hypothetical protein
MRTIFHYNPQLLAQDLTVPAQSSENNEDWPLPIPRRRLMQQKESWLFVLQFCRRALFYTAGLLESMPQESVSIAASNSAGEPEELDDEQQRQMFQQWLRGAWQQAQTKEALDTYANLLRYSMQNQSADARIHSVASVCLAELLLSSPGPILATNFRHLSWLKVMRIHISSPK